VVVGQILEEARYALLQEDEAGIADVLRRLHIAMPDLVKFLNRGADEDLHAQKFADAALKSRLLERLFPENLYFFRRRVEAEHAAGDKRSLRELEEASHRLQSDNDILWAGELLLQSNKREAVGRLIAESVDGGRDEDVIVVLKAGLLAHGGQTGRGLSVLETRLATERPLLAVLRTYGEFSERLGAYDAAWSARCRAAVLYGEEHDLGRAVDVALFFFRFSDVHGLLKAYESAHPQRVDIIEMAAKKSIAAQELAIAAIKQNGPCSYEDRTRVIGVLRDKAASADAILWAKQAVSALFASDDVTESDVVLFGEFAPNWEDQRIRNHVLRKGIERFPSSPTVRQRWLRYLVGQREFGTASQFLLSNLTDRPNDTIIFIATMLLRIERSRSAPSFLSAEDASVLAQFVSKSLRSLGAGFRVVMHEQLETLGVADEGCLFSTANENGRDAELEFLRFFGRMTGRLDRRKPARSAEYHTQGPIHPIVAISGQLRGFKDAWPGICQWIVKPLGAPVVMSTWDKTKNAQGRHGGRLERLLPGDVARALLTEEKFSDVFERHYPNTFNLLYGETSVDVNDIQRWIEDEGAECVAAETESDQLLEMVMRPTLDNPMLKMFYKWHRAENLIAEAENRQGKLYSHVVWLRPDCKVLSLPESELQACLSSDEVVYSSWNSDIAIGDYAMVLPRRAFATIASIFPRVASAGSARLLPWRPYGRNHDVLSPPETIFDILISEGFSPFGRINRFRLQLLGLTPEPELISKTFFAEFKSQRL
jgi:hypothetical protein